MFDQDNWQEIVSTLKRNKLRSLMTAFGVFWGLLMLIVMLGSGSGLEHGVSKRFNDRATNSTYLWTRKTSKPYLGFPRGRRFQFENDDIQSLRHKIPEIEYLAPRNSLGGHQGANNVVRNGKVGAFTIYGDYPDVQHIQLLTMTKGRFINELDLAEKRKVAVIGTRVYKILFDKGEDPIGKYIQVKGIFFRVIGVFKTNRSGDDEEEHTQTVFIPFSSFQQAFNYGNRIGWFAITSIKGVPVSEVEKKAIALLARNHQIAPDDQQAFGFWNAEKEYNKINGVFFGINALVWFVGVSTLLAGVIGVSNIMLIVVKERTREIGIRRAVGATPFSIISQILLETICLTSIAGYFGLVLGVAGIELLASLIARGQIKMDMFDKPQVDFQMACIALLVLIFSGALAGLIPAHKAVSIKPVEAIHTE
ncbi:MAG: ABC transporter permease [SAR324 cluster bacterium]|nr:ABC transporter permease [SAR324 cluster bacterium]